MKNVGNWGGGMAAYGEDEVVLDLEVDVRVEAIAEVAPPLSGAPLIVVGDARARAILGELLNEYTPFGCTIEDDMLVEMASSTADSAVRLALQGHDVEYWYAGVARAYRRIQANRLGDGDKERWACTLDAGRLSVGLLHRLFPDAHIVNVVAGNKRARREQRAIRHAAGVLPPRRYHEVAEDDLVSRTEECLLRLLAAVDMPAH